MAGGMTSPTPPLLAHSVGVRHAKLAEPLGIEAQTCPSPTVAG